MSSDPRRVHRPASLALRVTLLVGVVIALVFLSFSWLVERSLEFHFAEQDAGELAAVATAVSRALAETPGDAPLVQRQARLAGAVSGHHKVYYYVGDGQGRQVYTNGGPDLHALSARLAPVAALEARTVSVWEEGGSTYRGGVLRVPAPSASGAEPADELRIAVAMDMDFHMTYLHRFKRMIWWATGVVLCLALLVAWLAVQWGHVPIRKVNARIRAIGSSQLHVRLNPQEVPVELTDLVVAFNDMLQRLENGFQQLSNFSADIAHELRTPVTNLTTHTQVALSQVRSADEYREVLYSNLEEFEQMSRMIGDMLFLAQTENDPGSRRLVPVDLTELAEDLFDYFGAWAEDRQVHLRRAGEASKVNADRDMMRRALGNLLSNAVQHTAPGQAVEVHLADTGDVAVIRVSNPGKRIPAEALPLLFNRFYRLDPARRRKGQGAGLGLAIVKSIVELHGGQVRACSDDAHTTFEVTLPLARTT
ncbi:heavy metal sensor histidine kinase [Imbroritus primus]|uniref:heavy metal sensor histidine kinase n=1 Tax=Imbroritus primus TaxID=3058603 RepID=UPI003D161A06